MALGFSEQAKPSCQLDTAQSEHTGFVCPFQKLLIQGQCLGGKPEPLIHQSLPGDHLRRPYAKGLQPGKHVQTLGQFPSVKVHLGEFSKNRSVSRLHSE